MNYQRRYWKEFDQLIVHINYVELYFEKTAKIENRIDAFMAVTSSAVIAGWAIWNEYSLIWGFIIASSQVLNVLRRYMPFTERLRGLRGLSAELSGLSIIMERDWHNVAEGTLTNRQINDLIAHYQNMKHQIVERNMQYSLLPENEKLHEKAKAKAKAKAFFNNIYN